MEPLAGAAVLAALVWKMGAGPFLDGFKAVNVQALVAAAAITLATTVCCAWRWRLVARGLGFEIPLGGAIAAYYRSQFLNSVLPGGVLGDVHRGVKHGQESGQAGRGLRAVVWERAAGQTVQLILAVGLLALLPSAVHQLSAFLAVVLLAVVSATLFALHWRSVAGTRWWARALRASAADIRSGVLNWSTAPGVVVASVAAVGGYTAIFLIAARTAGITAPLGQLLPLAVLVLLAMSVPANIAGWGPREGAAAWAFGAAGLGAAQGVSAAVVYGVLTFASVVPGAVVLAVGWVRSPDKQGEPHA
ncbi:lysylphosphatidylglycerol synthase transmembrane domain-containing protein [Arthrobacter glacialis]|uniref:lysylphosphatidylglycerol synthase transmembrane domain-containing protein n=1 Tax=Arthrobacter glacialis TaxID=1664 RepID=UPI001FAF29E2|nr:lysylphosphatidylglycerol synthase transmembrane domain-containing protein [Arthrobacter glacialis]